LAKVQYTRYDQSPSRWIINFFDWSLEKAESYEKPMAILREKVYPIRANVRRKAHRKYWWHYGDKRPALYSKIVGLEKVLVKTQVSRTWAFCFISPGMVYDQRLVVFPTESYRVFAALQSEIHWIWATVFSSTLKQDMSYTPSDAFETFPIPYDAGGKLHSIGYSLHKYRQQLMRDWRVGLTETYNRFHDPAEKGGEISQLRNLHVEMDYDIASAYRWDDLKLDHNFRETLQGLRFTIGEAARREVLRRLLELNHQRYQEEVIQGLHEKQGGKGGTQRTKKSRRKPPKGQIGMF
jgi:hypothetical protein